MYFSGRYNYILEPFWYKQKRETVLAQLLTQCHSCLKIGETIELYTLSRVSKKTITGADILRNSDIGEGTFNYRELVNQDLSDAGYVAWQVSGEAQDSFLKTLVAADGSTATVISDEVLEVPFVQASSNVKKIGTLHFNRKLGREAEISFTGSSKLLGLQPDDVVTINATNYGGEYDVLIDSVKINKDVSVEIRCTKYSHEILDWGDVSAGVVTVATDDTSGQWQPVIAGPDGENTNILPGRLRLSDTSDYILLDPTTMQLSLFDNGTEVFRAGDLNGYLGYVAETFGIAMGETNKYLKYDTVNGLRIKGDITVSEGSIGWSDIADDDGFKPSNDADVTLSAINGGLTVTGGGITLSAGGSIKAGQTDYATGTGFYLGYSTDDYKFSIGDATDYLKWDGTTLEVSRPSVTDPTTLANGTVTGLTLTTGPTILYIRTGINDATNPWSAVSNTTYQGRAKASDGDRAAGHDMVFWTIEVEVFQISGFEDTESVGYPNYVTWQGDDWYRNDIGLKVTITCLNYVATDQIHEVNWALMAV